MRAALLPLVIAAVAACAGPASTPRLTVAGYTGVDGHANSFVIAGPRHAIIVDGQRTVDDAMAVVAMLQRRDLIPVAAIVTRAAPDRAAGLATLRLAYPELRIYATAPVQAAYAALTTPAPVELARLADPTLTLDGAAIEVVALATDRGAATTALRVPSAHAVIAGDTLDDDAWAPIRAAWLAGEPDDTRYYPDRGPFPRAAAALAPSPAALVAAVTGPCRRGTDRAAGTPSSSPGTRAAAR